jgi:hypothetical protein
MVVSLSFTDTYSFAGAVRLQTLFSRLWTGGEREIEMTKEIENSIQGSRCARFGNASTGLAWGELFRRRVEADA